MMTTKTDRIETNIIFVSKVRAPIMVYMFLRCTLVINLSITAPT